ncbi:MAG TPA: CRISPR-associated endonuclease Cas1 [Candidatus Acidoferrales bacterium]|nr:CRISPR-associated endonuclease Cas1 [Candidatus Acidoferrales bacterium]
MIIKSREIRAVLRTDRLHHIGLYGDQCRSLLRPRTFREYRSIGEHSEAENRPLPRHRTLVVNPPNAMLNYLYALPESEARLAAAALELDPRLGVMHFDSPSRDSLASDLMEPIRPRVDAYVLDWLLRSPLRREWFFEQRDGN